MSNAEKALELFDGSEGLTIRRVSVMAQVWFDAYVIVDERDDNAVDIARIEHEVADAIEYHAPHLSGAGEGDALVAMVMEPGTGDAILSVTVTGTFEHEPAVALSDVAQAIEATEAWL